MSYSPHFVRGLCNARAPGTGAMKMLRVGRVVAPSESARPRLWYTPADMYPRVLEGVPYLGVCPSSDAPIGFLLGAKGMQRVSLCLRGYHCESAWLPARHTAMRTLCALARPPELGWIEETESRAKRTGFAASDGFVDHEELRATPAMHVPS